MSKNDFLLAAAKKFDCLYVPSLYEVKYTGDKLESIKPKFADIPARLENAIVDDFENAPVPLKPIVPFVEAVHDRISIEIMRAVRPMPILSGVALLSAYLLSQSG
jgi:hypothetical protein